VLSVTVPKVPLLTPPLLKNTIVSPPPVSWFPFASFAVKVRVTFEPEVTVEFETVMRDCVAEKDPGVTVKFTALLVNTDPPTVPEIAVGVPAPVPVNVAV